MTEKDSTNGLWKSDGLHFSKTGSREFGRRMATGARELLRPQEFVSLAKEVMWLLSKKVWASHGQDFVRLVNVGRAAPGKSRGNFLGQQQVKAQLEGLSAAQHREVSGTASFAEKHNVLDPNGTSEDVVGRRG